MNAAISATDAGRLSSIRSAIVTGSSSGIGRAIALGLAAAGVRLVVCADLTPGPGAGEGAVWETAEEERQLATHQLVSRRHGVGRAIFVRCDVTCESARPDGTGPVAVEGGDVGNTIWGVVDLVAETVARAGQLDV